MILFRALLRPVSVTELVTVVLKSGEHDNDDTALLPDHLPEVCHRLGQGTLGHDVRWVPRVMVTLRDKNRYFSGQFVLPQTAVEAHFKYLDKSCHTLEQR